jgi:ATP citrate (pro-S)-lyase
VPTKVIAIGGDRYPGSTFIDHLLRYEADPACKMLVLLGAVGGVEEFRVIEAVKSGQIKKSIVAWAIGTCASMFATEVQFGHAGSMANSDLQMLPLLMSSSGPVKIPDGAW